MAEGPANVGSPFDSYNIKSSLSQWHFSGYSVLLSGNLVELADILGLHTPPTGDKTLHIIL